jgi:hypothetical protein
MCTPLAVLALAACSRLPDRIESVEQARESIASLEREPLAGRVAAREIAAGREALAAADDAYEERAPLTLIEHNAYLAQISWRTTLAQCAATVNREASGVDLTFATHLAASPRCECQNRTTCRCDKLSQSCAASVPAISTHRVAIR